MTNCLAKDRNGDNCRNYGLEKTRFCKFHHYMNDYTEEMLNSIELCKGCKKMYYFEGELKTCEKCRERKNTNKKATITLCSKGGCKFKRSDENKYCGKHQICIFEDETANMNKKVCYNIIRGCRSQLDTEYAYTRCDLCLEKDREKNKERRSKAKEINELNSDKHTKLCGSCCKELPIDNFIGLLSVITKTCDVCRKQNKTQDKKRDKEHRNETVRNNTKPQYTNYKKSANERNIAFNISYDEYIKIVKNTCYYCGTIHERGFNGIDRTDSSRGYVLDNCVSCCQMCNYMKGSLSKSVFIKRVEHILTFHNKILGKLYPDCFANHKKTTYNQYTTRAINMGIEFTITKADYDSITDHTCYICGKPNDENNENGMDRLDSSKGYTLNNIKACCAECNCMKIDYTFDSIIEKFILINNKHKGETVLINEENIRNFRFGKNKIL